MTKDHDIPAGILGERVRMRDEDLRSRYASVGFILGVRHVVEVQYNDFDGTGPYVVEHDMHDLERLHARDCQATARSKGETYLCDMPLDYRGVCPCADRHVKEEK